MTLQLSDFRITVFQDESPFCARIILHDRWQASIEKARDCLLAVIRAWPRGISTKFLITCGGFITFEWPQDLNIKDIYQTTEQDRKTLLKKCESCNF